MSRSLALARPFLEQAVEVLMDRPLGSRHPHHGFVYGVNYGFVPGTLAPDGAPLDAYALAVGVPLARFQGVCVALSHRYDDDDDKLVVVAKGMVLTDAEITAAVRFQEQFFRTGVVRQGQSLA